MRIITAREQFAMTNPWLREALDIADGVRPPGRGNPNEGYGKQLSRPDLPQAPEAGSAPWMAADWRNASDGGAFHSSVRPPMSSDIPHPSEVLDPNNKAHTKPRVYSVKNPKTKETIRYHLPSWIDSMTGSADPQNDPYGVMTPYNKVEHVTADGQVSDITHDFHLGQGNTPEHLVQNNQGHHDNMTPEQAYQGRVWYRGAHEGTKDLSDKTVGDHARAVHTMSAYSPKTDWDENLEKGHHFLTHYSGNPDDPTGTGDPAAQITPGMQSPVRKAIDIYHAHPDEIANANSGPKTSAFANNILDATPMREPRPGVDDDAGHYEHAVNPHTNEPDWRLHPDQDSTIDTHAVRLMNTPHGDQDALRQLKYGVPPHFEAGLTVGGREIKPGYDLYARSNWETTRRVNAEKPDPLQHLIPKQVQAGPWGKFKTDLDVANGKTSPEPGQMPGGLQKQFDMKKNRDRSRADVEREWGEKNQLNNPIPRYQRDQGDFWNDPRRPDVDLSAAPGWGNRSQVGRPSIHEQEHNQRRSMRLAATGSPIFDQWLSDYIQRHPQYGHPQPVLASRADRELLAFVDGLL